jgi:hypothetical protein
VAGRELSGDGMKQNRQAVAVKSVSHMRVWVAPLLPFVVIVATALVLSFPPSQHIEQPVKLFPDSVTYLQWTNGRPPTPSLFYALVGSGGAVCIVQTVLSIVAWTAFGWTALGVVGGVVAAALAAALPVALWNFTVLSESLSLTLGAALCAATLGLGRQWTWPRFLAWSAAALLFTGVRVENFVIVPIFGAALLAWHRVHWRAVGIIGAATAALFLVFGVLLDKQSRNWQTRMTNIVLTRILPDAELADDFYRRGLPHEATMLEYRGQMLEDYSAEFRQRTPAFQRWLDAESRDTYVRWLATAAPHRRLIAWMDIIMGRGQYDYYTGGVRLPKIASDLVRFYDAVLLPFRVWVWLALVPIACAAVTRRPYFIDLYALAFLAAVYVIAFVVYHADAGELDRHIILASALYRMAPVVVLGCIWARFARRGRA